MIVNLGIALVDIFSVNFPRCVAKFIGKLGSISRETHEFIIYEMRQRVRVDNLRAIYCYFDNIMTKFMINNRTDA